MRHSNLLKRLSAILVLVLASLACSLPSQSSSQPTPPAGFQETSIALAVQQTSVANDKATLAAHDAITDTPAPTASREPTQTREPTETREPTAAPQATATLAPNKPTLAPPTATLEPTAKPIDMDAKIRGANVLVFEDMASFYKRSPVVREAVSEMNFSGGRVIEVGDALGNFKEQLINSTKWDLILVAAEYRTAVQGEFWKYVYDQVNRGTAVAVEIWYLDKHLSDIQPLLSKCGVAYQKNWLRGPKYKIEDYAIYWLQPEHPFFQPPQDTVSLANPNYLFWVPPLTEDAGDLLKLDSGGDAEILAGTQPNLRGQYGVVASCIKGTMILQTYSSHDYKPSEVVKMWKNYIRYTLTNHFNQQK